MRTFRLHLVAAARPNFMKIAPLYHALRETSWCEPIIVHTGQHYDVNMSEVFLNDLKLPAPHYNLNVGSGTHAEQTAGVLLAYEKLCKDARPDWTVVAGDVNSTLAAALAAKKSALPVAHLEAGLRSFDRTMPEEINRVVVDQISDLLWTPSPDADENLINEGIPIERIQRVGNIMLDSFEMLHGRIETEQPYKPLGLTTGSYAVVTLHRPVNVDDAKSLGHIVEILIELAEKLPFVFPVHPRTHKQLQRFGLESALKKSAGIHLLGPLSYIPFMGLVRGACFVLTDSGGIQEETTYLDIPCLTLRTSTERPITLSQGSNRLVRREEIYPIVKKILEGQWPKAIRPELWDGKTADRIVKNLSAILQK